MAHLSDAIEFLRMIMWDVMPDPIRKCLAVLIFLGIFYGIRKIVHLGGGD